jgi:hypothetical protein
VLCIVVTAEIDGGNDDSFCNVISVDIEGGDVIVSCIVVGVGDVIGGEGAVGFIGCCRKDVSAVLILAIISSLLLLLPLPVPLPLLPLLDSSVMCGSDNVD